MADPAPAPPRSEPPQRPASDPLPDGGTAAAVPSPRAGDDAPRTPDEYLETPGSHRSEDGAATDVGA